MYPIRPSSRLFKNAWNVCAGAQLVSMRVSHMIPLRWQDPPDFATSARQYAAFVQLCCREIPSLHISFVASVRISVMLVQPSAKNTNIAKQCGNAPRRAVAVRRRAGKLPNLVLFEKLPRRWQGVEWISDADCRTQPKKMAWAPQRVRRTRPDRGYAYIRL